MVKDSASAPHIPPCRVLPADITAWAADHLLPTSPYRRIGDRTYPMLYQAYTEELVGLPASCGLIPLDLAILTALDGLADLPVDGAGARLAPAPACTYTLRLPHPSCAGAALWRFAKHSDHTGERYRILMGMVLEMVRLAFIPRP